MKKVIGILVVIGLIVAIECAESTQNGGILQNEKEKVFRNIITPIGYSLIIVRENKTRIAHIYIPDNNTVITIGETNGLLQARGSSIKLGEDSVLKLELRAKIALLYYNKYLSSWSNPNLETLPRSSEIQSKLHFITFGSWEEEDRICVEVSVPIKNKEGSKKYKIIEFSRDG